MIDLHCHILPGVDDGPSGMEDALAMGAQAAADGITAICATPHIRDDHDVLIEEVGARAAELEHELRRREIGVRILPGGEVAETALERLDEEELRQVALGDGRWILLEPGPGPLSASLTEAVAHLADRGCRTLVAHPERHYGPGWEERLLDLVRGGALIQATAAFLEDDDSAMVALAERGLVHVLGSDSHSSRVGRPVRLSAGLEGLLRANRLRRHRRWIAEIAPAAIVNGEQVRPPYPAA